MSSCHHFTIYIYIPNHSFHFLDGSNQLNSLTYIFHYFNSRNRLHPFQCPCQSLTFWGTRRRHSLTRGFCRCSPSRKLQTFCRVWAWWAGSGRPGCSTCRRCVWVSTTGPRAASLAASTWGPAAHSTAWICNPAACPRTSSFQSKTPKFQTTRSTPAKTIHFLWIYRWFWCKFDQRRYWYCIFAH